MPAPEQSPIATTEAESNAASSSGLCPLSFAQERLWFLDQLEPGSANYNISQAWRLHGTLNPAAFENALNEVIRRHETLRTTFSRIEGKAVVIISAFKPARLEPVDVSMEIDPVAAADKWIERAARKPFNLQQGPLIRVNLFRLSANEHIALFTLHHIISDAWSFEILRREFGAVYAATLDGKPAHLPNLPIQYLDYAHWQREQFADTALQDETAFWRQQLSGEIPRLDLPSDRHASKPHSIGASEAFKLSTELTASFRALARAEGATLFTVLLAGFTAFLHRITEQYDIVIGTPISGRDQPETEGLIGMFVNTLPLRMRLNGDPTFRQLLATARDVCFNAFAHGTVPFDEIVKAAQPDRATGDNPFFNVVLALHGGYSPQWLLGNLTATTIDIITPTAKFDWTLLLEEAEDGIKGRLEFKTNQFEAASIRSFLQRIQVLLGGIVTNPDRRISELPLMTESERQLLLVDWNQTSTSYGRDACIHDLFEAQVTKTPEATALVFGPERITYRKLNERANQLAHRLRKAGVQTETLVGLCLDRSVEMIIAMLAILKAGGGYVPLDRNYPAERLAFMLRDTALPVLITDSQFASTLPRNSVRKIIHLDQERGLESEPTGNLPSATTAEDLAYVIYTSGSTGTPKGAAIPHRGVVRLVRGADYATFSPSDVMLQLAPISFDASTFEIWGALLNGATLVIHPPHIPSLEELGRTIESHQITMLWLTAGLFHQIVDHQLASLKSVRQLLAGGDVLSVPQVLRVLRELPDCQLINGYGPTENTTFTCCYRIPADWTGGQSVPIGKPIRNTRVYVLDRHLAPVPVGIPGELFIAGDGLARGYLNRSELNAEKFVRWNHPGVGVTETLYRTGDRVRWLPDGNLEFLGRKDQQVKIRGFRIEPGEVEAVLKQHPGIRDAAIVARESRGQDRQLVAYLTLRDGAVVDEPALREFLNAKLPAYMIPTRFVPLPALPLTPNGKLDTRALPTPESENIIVGATSPRNSAEESLCEIWREILGRNSFGVHDNFFHLGGHSLLVTQMVSRIARIFHFELPVRAVFEAPTIASLAERIQRTTPAAPAQKISRRRTATAEAHELLARINELSDAEVESLLSREK
ncbi:MAG TPA: amino acid adenylation domain-containing protein [Candidatus Paceibacterota bacterium]|nr:amino acid adenylation domain-containing protein [Candidatus Paceibacterota bacterium]